MEVLNVGTGHTIQAFPPPLDITVQVDIDRKWEGVTVVCDVCHLPFKDHAFSKSYCFHVIEHLESPVLGLKEMIRVTRDLVEIEVPHRFSHMAKSKEHVTSFKTTWFYRTLNNYVFSLKTPWDFPLNIAIHVWIYPSLKRTKL